MITMEQFQQELVEAFIDEEYMQKFHKEGVEQERQNHLSRMFDFARVLFQTGVEDDEQISTMTGLTVEEVQAVRLEFDEINHNN